MPWRARRIGIRDFWIFRFSLLTSFLQGDRQRRHVSQNSRKPDLFLFFCLSLSERQKKLCKREKNRRPEAKTRRKWRVFVSQLACCLSMSLNDCRNRSGFVYMFQRRTCPASRSVMNDGSPFARSPNRMETSNSSKNTRATNQAASTSLRSVGCCHSSGYDGTSR